MDSAAEALDTLLTLVRQRGGDKEALRQVGMEYGIKQLGIWVMTFTQGTLVVRDVEGIMSARVIVNALVLGKSLGLITLDDCQNVGTSVRTLEDTDFTTYSCPCVLREKVEYCQSKGQQQLEAPNSHFCAKAILRRER